MRGIKQETTEDHRVAVRVRMELQRCREDGFAWTDTVWQDALDYGLLVARGRERSYWQSALAWAEPAFRDAYERADRAPFRYGLPD